jgi:aquaglyceroporin related protein
MAAEKSFPSMSLTAHAENVSTPAKYRTTAVPGEPAYAEHGALSGHKGPQENVVQAAPDLLWSRARYFLREPFSEFSAFSSFLMFGDGVVAQVVLRNGEMGDYQSIS